MSTLMDPHPDAVTEDPAGPASRPAGCAFGLPAGQLDLMTRTRARLLASDVQATMAPDARCVVTAEPAHVRVELEGRLVAGPGALHLVCRRADRWGLSLGDARADQVWFELDR